MTEIIRILADHPFFAFFVGIPVFVVGISFLAYLVEVFFD